MTVIIVIIIIIVTIIIIIIIINIIIIVINTETFYEGFSFTVILLPQFIVIREFY